MPTLSRKNDYFIFMQNGDIITNLLNEDAKKEELIRKVDPRHASLHKILKLTTKANMTVDQKNTSIRDILIGLGVSTDTVDKRLYDR